MRIRFGATTGQFVPFEALLRDVRFVEGLGFDNAWVVDDFEVDGVPELSMREAWASLAGLATQTDRIRLGAMVSAMGIRSPSMLAKSALTVDEMSGGRVDVAVGAGFSATDHAAYGMDFLDAPGRRSRLAEGVEVLDKLLGGDTVTHDGNYVKITNARVGPQSVQRPRPPIWVAAQTAGSIEIAAHYGDVLVCLGPTDEDLDPVAAFRARMETANRACERIGRDPVTLRRCYFAGFADEPIFLSNEATGDFVDRYVDAGATDFTFYVANESAPQLHALVDQGRMATRATLESVASEVLAAFKD